MSYFIACVSVFVLAYLVNILYITVFYHRGLTHGALELHPRLKKVVVMTGSWVTGLDPKGWACMHRLHHAHSDTKEDPHSPLAYGVFGVLLAQLHSYNRALVGLIVGNSYYTSMVKDLDFPVNWLNRHKLWILPYLLHATIAIIIGITFHAWLFAACYWLGIMSHPIQGWMVNSLAHKFGYRNFAIEDNSKNNLLVSWLVFGEGFQNNHHKDPSSAKFSSKWWEVDLGYYLCKVLSFFRLLKFSRA